jgi:hypothetical protein
MKCHQFELCQKGKLCAAQYCSQDRIRVAPQKVDHLLELGRNPTVHGSVGTSEFLTIPRLPKSQESQYATGNDIAQEADAGWPGSCCP